MMERRRLSASTAGNRRLRSCFVAILIAGLAMSALVHAQAPQAAPSSDPPDAEGASGIVPAPPPPAPQLSFYRDQPGGGGSRSRRELAGLFVNGREIPEGLALLRQADGTRLVPLGELAARLGSTLIEEREAWSMETPLGQARFAVADVVRFGDEVFVVLPRFAEAMAAEAAFDESLFAVVIRLLWDTRPQPGRAPEEPIRPDLHAPGLSLSRMRGEISTQRDDFGSREFGFAEFEGRMGPGLWRMRTETDFDGELYARDYTWRTVRGSHGFLLGHQVVGANALFPSFDLTGAQWAYSNRPDRLLAPIDPGRLTADRLGPSRTIRGEGPPGGVAELIVDGIPRARVRIPLDGEFEFPDVSLAPGFVQIEVALYEPTALGAPIEILDFSGRASDRILPYGAHLVHAGFGQEGNPLDDRRSADGAAGFVQGRVGLSEHLTVDAAWQSSEGGDFAALGAAVSAGPVGVLAVSAAESDGAQAWLANIEGGRGPVFWRATAREFDAGYRGNGSRSSDRYAETGWRHWPTWEISVVAREREHDEVDTSFVLPAARWRPRPGMLIQSRPDALGDYVHDLSWRFNRATRLGLRRDSRSEQAQLDYSFSRTMRLSASTLRDRESGRSRNAVLGSYQDLGRRGWFVDLGVLESEGDAGFIARTGLELVPGVRARLEARRDPLIDAGAADAGTLVLASLSWDLGRAGRGFTRASGGRSTAGSIGGVLSVPVTTLDAPLDGVAIRVDGRVRGQTDAQGRFHISDLAPGVYRVELDAEGLPLELSPEDVGYWVEVAAGAATTLRFRVEVRLGAAGRLYGVDGGPSAGGSIHVLDDEGRVRARSAVSAFGYYRIDGLPPGTYRAVWIDEDGATLGQRELVLTDTFVFAQDIHADPASALSSDNDRSAEDENEQD